MAAYVDIYDMQDNATFRKQVSMACRIAANQILNEDPETANHAIRLLWATSVLEGMGGSNIEQRMGSAVSGNATLQATAPDGPWSDSDIQFVVNSFIDLLAATLA